MVFLYSQFLRNFYDFLFLYWLFSILKQAPLIFAANDEQKKKYLGRMTEPGQEKPLISVNLNSKDPSIIITS